MCVEMLLGPAPAPQTALPPLLLSPHTHANKHGEIHTNTPNTNKQTNKQTHTHTHTQTNKQTNTHTHTHTHIKKHTQKETHKNVTHAPSFCRTAGAEDAVPRASRNTRATHRLLGPSAGEKDEREKEEMQREFLARDDRLLGPRADESTASKENQVMSLFPPHLRVDHCLCYCMAASSM